LQNQTKQVKELEEQKKEKDVVVSGLKSQEKDLKRQIDIKKKRDRDLVSNINKIVQKEIADARKAAAERIAAEKKAADEKKNNATTVVTTNPTTTAPTKPEVIVEKRKHYLRPLVQMWYLIQMQN
jgi:septal ring factor EnvC (AmiA/AmiB activator)